MSEFDISYDPRKAIKSRALANFIQEMTIDKTIEQKWLMYADGYSMIGGSVRGIILISPKGNQLEYAAEFGLGF